MADFIPRSDREFLTWLQNFLNVADEFKVEAGLTPTQIDEFLP